MRRRTTETSLKGMTCPNPSEWLLGESKLDETAVLVITRNR
jgi:hypothetical protein